MTSRVYGATEKKILAQLERNLDAARKDGASWRVLWSLIDGAAGTLHEIGVDPERFELRTALPADVEIRTLGDPEPRYVPAGPEFWDGHGKMIGGNTVTAEPIYEGEGS